MSAAVNPLAKNEQRGITFNYWVHVVSVILGKRLDHVVTGLR
jgi:hypothetical protein